MNWFRRFNNDPFTIPGTVDATTYSRDTANLPAGHLFSANANRSVGSSLGVAASQAVMHQGTRPGEANRALGHDDVAGLRYAMAGFDQTAGTADDYVIALQYAGLDDGANIVIDFDNDEADLAITVARGLLTSTPSLTYAVITEA